MMAPETCRSWNAQAGEWQDVTIEVPEQPRRRTCRRHTRPGRAVDLAGLAAASPLPDWWRDTAYAPSDGLADMRTYIKTETTRTHRAPVIAWTGTPAERYRQAA